ncbi:MAG: TonB-dependent receptor [bacterium]|nr:TonB-dependent receptor [bacterium]
MRASLLILLLLTVGKVAFSQSSMDNSMLFKDFIAYIDENSDYRFSYPDDIKNKRLIINERININDPDSFKEFLESAGIAIKVRKNLLIFKKVKVFEEPVISEQQNEVQNRVVSGFVRDGNSGESLIGAHVIDIATGRGVTTNLYGFFSLTLTGDTIEVSFIGYEPQRIVAKPGVSDYEFGLIPSTKMLSEVVITSEREIHEVTEMSKVTLQPEKIKKLPVFMGETDVMKTLQLLPGVQSGNEGSSGIYVRGGGQDQNLILLDGVPVYNANHLFGFFSVFNADAINQVSLIKGGFPARYGGKLSSVIDIQMKEGNMNEFEGEGAVGLIASKLTLSGPINQGKTSFMVSGRRTYIDALTVPLMKWSGADRVFGYNFWDLNAKINHIANPKDRFYLSFYSGRDKFYNDYKFNQIADINEKEHSNINWGNITSAFRWNRRFTDRLFGNLTATYSRYRFELETILDYNYGESVESPDLYRENDYFSNIQDLGVKMDFDYFLNNNHQVKFGVNAINHQLKPGISSFRSHTETDTTFGSTKVDLNEFYAYLEDEFKLFNSTSLNVGLHFSGAEVASRNYFYLQPRISLNQKVAKNWSVKASYARMAQYIHLLVNSGVGLPTDLWVPSTDLVKPQVSDQIALGVASTFIGMEVSVEGYYKWMDNLIEYKEGAGFLDIDSEWEHKVEFGKGDSYGVELFVQKKVGRSTGWVGYTWSKTTREFPNLNFGKPFPYRYDRRHDISVVYNYELNKRINVSGVWVYGTGNAITLPTASIPKATWDSSGPSYEEFVKQYPGRNSTRMQDYHRLDLSISFKKQKRWGERSWVFGVYNAYSRQNPTFIDFDDTKPNEKQFKKISLFPIIPNVSYQFKF